MTVVQDPLNKVTTYTYSSTQKGMLICQTAPAPSGSGSYTLWSYAYDSTDRLTAITDAGSDVTKRTYDSGGRLTSNTDPNGHQRTYSPDAMDGVTGQTAAQRREVRKPNWVANQRLKQSAALTMIDSRWRSRSSDRLGSLV
jgi:YD repeat-containing protein